MLDAVDVLQSAATALDLTDEACTTGEGSPARTQHRKAVPLALKAGNELRVLKGTLAAYGGALRVLAATSVVVDGMPRAALLRVVTGGQAEAAAIEAFRSRVTDLWPEYTALEKNEALWITRAVTPWYRNSQEGKDAYQVLMEDLRPSLDVARTQLGDAVDRVTPAIGSQGATLAAADKALEAVRSSGTK